MVVVPEADHSLKVPARATLTQAEVHALVVEATLEFVVRDIVGNRPGHPTVAI